MFWWLLIPYTPSFPSWMISQSSIARSRTKSRTCLRPISRELKIWKEGKNILFGWPVLGSDEWSNQTKCVYFKTCFFLAELRLGLNMWNQPSIKHVSYTSMVTGCVQEAACTVQLVKYVYIVHSHTLIHTFKLQKGVSVKEVFLSRKSLDSTDVFILDLGLEIYQWNGKTCNKDEKFKAVQYLQQIKVFIFLLIRAHSLISFLTFFLISITFSRSEVESQKWSL